jgi:hypothetical protein
MLGEDHDCRPRPPSTDLEGGAQAVVGVVRGHPDIRDHQFGLEVLGEPSELAGLAGNAYDVEVGLTKDEQ